LIDIKIRDLRKKFGNKEVLKGVNLDIKAGKTTVIFGLSGGGKSTIIKHVVGLLKADKGEILIGGTDVCKADSRALFEVRKKVGFLFQSGALFDSMNVFENVAFPLKEHTKDSATTVSKKVEESLEMVGLRPKEVLKLYPDELSGGMRKRVGLARTIVLRPEVVLYDEPTSGLDPITSDLVTRMILSLQERLNITSVLISHDIKESFKAGDYFALLYDGVIVEYGDKESFMSSQNQVVKQVLAGSSEGPISLVGNTDW